MKLLVTIILVFGLLNFVDVNAQQFMLKSTDVGTRLTETQVYSGFGCHGKNISPSLSWSNAPQQTKSFAVTVHDPDAPKLGGWWHWLIFNIPADVKELKSNAGNIKQRLAPEGTLQSVTSFGTPGYGGACPPKGDKPHRYMFTIAALNVTKLNINEKTPAILVEGMIKQHTLATASFLTYYSR